jgi:diguanylate cyclase (GGDEF)-like protein
MERMIGVLLLSQNAPQVERWRGILSECARLWHGSRELPVGVSIDVIVTDSVDFVGELDVPLGRCLAAREIGVIGIGLEATADVLLSADFAPRELQLACFLLAHTVRLRRRLHRSRRAGRAMRRLAFIDPLTSLPNRRAWDGRVLQQDSGDPKRGTGVCLALLDLDGFKSVNDQFGHIAGDEVLRHVGRGLAAASDDRCFAARVGGDEFGVLLTGRPAAEAAGHVEQLRTAVCAGSPVTSITASAGLASADELPDDGWDGLFHAADEALRLAKSAGGNQSVEAPQLQSS